MNSNIYYPFFLDADLDYLIQAKNIKTCSFGKYTLAGIFTSEKGQRNVVSLSAYIEMTEISEALSKRIEDKVTAIDVIANEIPGVIIIHRIPGFTVEYMSQNGLAHFGVTIAELKGMGQDYYVRYFNQDDAADYVPKVAAIIEKNNPEEQASFFQQVRRFPGDAWIWHFSITKIFMQDDNGMPVLAITTSVPVDPLQHITNKVERLLEENNFLREHYLLFALLTERERTVLGQLALSRTALEIAASLSISVHTVETHRKNIRKKLGITTAYELHRFALAFDLI